MKRKKEHLLSFSQVLSAIILVMVIAAINLFVYFWPRQEEIVEEVVVEEEKPAPVYLTKQKAKNEPRLFYFDPNTADSLTLIELGFRPWQVQNMYKYRAKGGRFKKPEDLRKLYGLSDSAYNELRPYIRIDSTQWVAHRDSMRILRHERDSLKRVTHNLRRDSIYTARGYRIKKDTIIELNSTDAETLEYIRGIGPNTARHIMQYGKELGGYVSPEQIREIHVLQDYKVPFDTIIPHLRAEKDSVTRMRVNYIGVDRLQRHPYLSFTQAKAIYELRRTKLYLNTIDDLRTLPCLTEEDIRRLRPYLSFEQ